MKRSQLNRPLSLTPGFGPRVTGRFLVMAEQRASDSISSAECVLEIRALPNIEVALCL